MTTVLIFLAVWFALSVPAAVFLGRVFALGGCERAVGPRVRVEQRRGQR